MAVSDEVRPARRRQRADTPAVDRHGHARRDRGADPVAGRPDDPRGEPRPAEPRRDQGRWPPGLERVGRVDPDRALLPLAARRRPGRHQAACLAGLSLAPVPARQPRCLDAHPPARVRRAAVVPVADQGPRPGRLLDRFGRARCGRPDVRGAGRSLPAAPFPRVDREPAGASVRGRSSATRSWTKATSGRRSSRRAWASSATSR